MTILNDTRQLHSAAVEQRRVRVRGVVTERGGGYGGSYRNTWLRIQTVGAAVHVTASVSSRLGTAPAGSEVDLALTLTGMVDVSTDVYFAQRAQLIDLSRPGD